MKTQDQDPLAATGKYTQVFQCNIGKKWPERDYLSEKPHQGESPPSFPFFLWVSPGDAAANWWLWEGTYMTKTLPHPHQEASGAYLTTLLSSYMTLGCLPARPSVTWEK